MLLYRREPIINHLLAGFIMTPGFNMFYELKCQWDLSFYLTQALPSFEYHGYVPPTAHTHSLRIICICVAMVIVYILFDHKVSFYTVISRSSSWFSFTGIESSCFPAFCCLGYREEGGRLQRLTWSQPGSAGWSDDLSRQGRLSTGEIEQRSRCCNHSCISTGGVPQLWTLLLLHDSLKGLQMAAYSVTLFYRGQDAFRSWVQIQVRSSNIKRVLGSLWLG